MSSQFQQKLAEALANAKIADVKTADAEPAVLRVVEPECHAVLKLQGCEPPALNHLDILATYSKYREEFLPLCPLVDPMGRKIRMGRFEFPKTINLRVKDGYFSKKPSTIVELIEGNRFVKEEYDWRKDRLQTLFWIPDLVQDPDAIFKKTKAHGLIKADEVYVKVYNRLGSKIKVLFIDRVGKHKTIIFITSYLTSLKTATKYCDGPALYTRK